MIDEKIFNLIYTLWRLSLLPAPLLKLEQKKGCFYQTRKPLERLGSDSCHFHLTFHLKQFTLPCTIAIYDETCGAMVHQDHSLCPSQLQMTCFKEESQPLPKHYYLVCSAISETKVLNLDMAWIFWLVKLSTLKDWWQFHFLWITMSIVLTRAEQMFFIFQNVFPDSASCNLINAGSLKAGKSSQYQQ